MMMVMKVRLATYVNILCRTAHNAVNHRRRTVVLWFQSYKGTVPHTPSTFDCGSCPTRDSRMAKLPRWRRPSPRTRYSDRTPRQMYLPCTKNTVLSRISKSIYTYTYEPQNTTCQGQIPPIRPMSGTLFTHYRKLEKQSWVFNFYVSPLNSILFNMNVVHKYTIIKWRKIKYIYYCKHKNCTIKSISSTLNKVWEQYP